MGHAYNSWWTGTDLTIEESRQLVPHQNATTVQVAIGVVGAVMWMIENPELGVLSPDDLPHDYVLRVAQPYLGKLISTPSDWTPLKHYRNMFHGYHDPSLDKDDPWQFKNFLVYDRD
jgi:homospermidine synthase